MPEGVPGPERTRRTIRRRLAALGVVAHGVSLSGLASASDLSWSGSSGCAPSEQLVFEVERALGAPLADTGAVHLQVHVERLPRGARALLRVDEPSAEPAVSERSLVAPDCERLLDTLAVAITLAIEAAAPAEVPASPPSPAPAIAAARTPAPMNETVAPAEVPVAEAGGPRPRVVARLLGDVGSLPAPALGLGLGAQLGWPRLRLELLGALWTERHARAGSDLAPSAGADLRLVTGTLSACATPLGADTDPLVLALCVGWEMGRVSGVGVGITAPRSAHGLWLAAALEAGLTWRPARTRLGVGAYIGAATPLGERTFYLERLGTVHEAAVLAARASLSLEVVLE